MKLENFEPNNSQEFDFSKVWGEAMEESKVGGNFAFPVSNKIREINPLDGIQTGVEANKTISKQELVRTSLMALKTAWEKAIKPQIGNIRAKGVETLKQGTDFFTQADKDSEEIIKKTFNDTFGENEIQIFGEEANKYTGNSSSEVSVRIDPIDGTESFKFGKQSWGIMVGVYEGKLGSEKQIIGAMLYPELNMLMYGVEGVGTFVCDLDSRRTKELAPVTSQDDLKNVIVSYWKHTDASQRGNNDVVHNLLTAEGARIRTTESTCGDVLEAAMTSGQRIFIYDGDMNKVDYIPYGVLERLGYKVYGWDGTEYRADDPELQNKKTVIVPPGLAGEKVREILKKIEEPT